MERWKWFAPSSTYGGDNLGTFFTRNSLLRERLQQKFWNLFFQQVMGSSIWFLSMGLKFEKFRGVGAPTPHPPTTKNSYLHEQNWPCSVILLLKIHPNMKKNLAVSWLVWGLQAPKLFFDKLPMGLWPTSGEFKIMKMSYSYSKGIYYLFTLSIS